VAGIAVLHAAVPPIPHWTLRRLAGILLVLLLLTQLLLGMYVNLFLALPETHPGTGMPWYVVRAADGLVWAVTRTNLAFEVHASLGVLLLVGGLVLVVLAVLARQRVWIAAAVSGLAGMVLAGVNGLNFMNLGGHALDSLLMAIGFTIATASYAVGLYITR
jgi:hypothetical protein